MTYKKTIVLYKKTIVLTPLIPDYLIEYVARQGMSDADIYYHFDISDLGEYENLLQRVNFFRIKMVEEVLDGATSVPSTLSIR